ncbi:MAG TPA: hypothetical protein VJU87_07265 [Gemmatimonadaceae bacterium]|nr:hypothetical protein [Gemmatimonadaceae bacterium]
MARRLGGTETQITALARAELDDFEPGWRAAFRYAEAMTRGGGKLPQQTFDELAAHWSPPQIVEITCVVTLFNYFNRFANALDIPPTK